MLRCRFTTLSSNLATDKFHLVCALRRRGRHPSGTCCPKWIRKYISISCIIFYSQNQNLTLHILSLSPWLGRGISASSKRNLCARSSTLDSMKFSDRLIFLQRFSDCPSKVINSALWRPSAVPNLMVVILTELDFSNVCWAASPYLN